MLEKFLLAKKFFRSINNDMKIHVSSNFGYLKQRIGIFVNRSKKYISPLPYSTKKSKTTGYTTAELVDMIHKWVV